MKTKKQTRQNNRRMTRSNHVKRSSRINKRAQHGGGLHKSMVDEKKLFDLLQVSRLTPPDLRKTGVIIPRVLELLESRMLMLKNYTDINGFVYISKNREHCFQLPHDTPKRISTIVGIANCFGSYSQGFKEIKVGFDAEKRLHQLLKTFMATMKALKFHECMQHTFHGFGTPFSFILADLINVTIHHCANLSHDEATTLRQLASDIGRAIVEMLNGAISQLHVLNVIKTNAIPAMVKAYQGKDTDEWDHALWEIIPSFLNPDGTEAEFNEAVDKFTTKLDTAIAQKKNALNSTIEFVYPFNLNLTHLSHRSVPASYDAEGVLQPSRPPTHAIGQIAADIALHDVEIAPRQRMSQMRGLSAFLINKLTMPPSYTPGAHASLQSKFYHPPEEEIYPVNAD
jgi:hypothetical protein